jgi:hypothetical protein
VSENPTDTYTVSFKSDEGYGAALLVVRGDNVAELEENLRAVHESLLETIVETKGLLHAAAGVSVTATAAKPAAASGGADVVGQDRFCNHGKREHKSGTSSKGKWEGWFCPQPKNASDKCDPVWGDK